MVQERRPEFGLASDSRKFCQVSRVPTLPVKKAMGVRTSECVIGERSKRDVLALWPLLESHLHVNGWVQVPCLQVHPWRSHPVDRECHEYIFVNMNIHQNLETDIHIHTSIDGNYLLLSKQYSRIFANINYSDSTTWNIHYLEIIHE
jgi:hypothetical protein